MKAGERARQREHDRARTRAVAVGTVATALAAALWAAPAQAQVNVETLTASMTEAGWGARLQGELGLAQGNVEFVETRLLGGAQYVTFHPAPAGTAQADGAQAAPKPLQPWLRQRGFMSGSIRRKTALGEQVADESFVHARWTAMWTRPVGTEVFGQLQSNAFQLLTWRALLGGGVRAVALNTEHVALWAGSGYMAESERLALEPGDPLDPTPLNHRWTSYVTLQVALDDRRAVLTNTSYIQPRLDDFGDVQWIDEGSLELRFGEHLRLGTSLNLRYDSRPPQTVQRRDLRISSFVAVVL